MVEVTTTMCGIIHRQAAGSLDRRRGTIGAALISYLIITYANATRLQSTPHWMEQRIIHTELGVTKTMDNLSGDIIGEVRLDVACSVEHTGSCMCVESTFSDIHTCRYHGDLEFVHNAAKSCVSPSVTLWRTQRCVHRNMS